MSLPFFTTDDGDIVLRTGPVLGPWHSFRVHKLILSLASPVFRDMFTFPQPPNQNQNEEHQLPIVDVPETPKVIDTILRLIYPGVEPPKITDLSIVPALLSAADKYNLTSIGHILKGTLKGFLPGDSFEVYVIACRFGFLEVAREATMVSTTRSILRRDYGEAIQHISNAGLFRFVRFVQAREFEGLSKIEEFLGWYNLHARCDCEHWVDSQDLYYRLAKEVGEEFVQNPRVELGGLLRVLDKVPDPPPGCEPPPNTAEFYHDGGDEEAFNCPLLSMSIRDKLMDVATELNYLNHRLLNKAFEGGVGGGTPMYSI